MKHLRVLVADDDRTNLELLNVILTSEGHRVILAQTGPAAVSLAEQDPPDLVLMDGYMPGEYDGIEATRRIKALPNFKGLVIIQSARASKIDQQIGLSTGADAYLTKPFRRRDVLGLIDHLLARTVGRPRGEHR